MSLSANHHLRLMERSKPLHNFSLSPELTWGRRRFLRCMNVNPIPAMPAVHDNESSDSREYNQNRFIKKRDAEVELTGGRSSDDRRKRVRFYLKPLSTSPSPAPKIGSIMKGISENEDEISVTREKLVMDFQTEVGKLKETILQNNTSNDNEIPPLDNADENSPPMNSKIDQKSRCNMPPPDEICTEGGGNGINAAVDDLTPEKKSTRPKRKLEKKEERAKLLIALSSNEIEDDFIAMTGKKPSRRPKKWPRNIQNQLRGIYPGSRLCEEVHLDLYK